MNTGYVIASYFIATILITLIYRWYKVRQRVAYIDSYVFHKGLILKFKKIRPELNSGQVETVVLALKDYFKIHQRAKNEFISMPSQVVDDLWHEFILFTKQYQRFCKESLGKYLHHVPSEAMTHQTMASEGIKNAWRYACALENIDPTNPTRLPRLFALDALYKISNGFHYTKDCKNNGGDAYCASHIGCSGHSDCSGASDSGSSCNSSCSSGCGGD